MSGDTINPDSPPVNPILKAKDEIRCRKCGWKLTDVSPTAVCPNCGASAIASTHGELLRFSLPSFLQSLAVGARLVFWRGILGVIFLIIGYVSGILRWPWLDTLVLPVTRVWTWVEGCAYFLGWWIITLPEPSGVGERSYGIWRKTTRVCASVLFVRFLAVELRHPLRDSILLAPLLNRIVEISRLPSLIPAIVAVSTALQILYLQKLTMRIPDNRLTKNARFYKIVLPPFFTASALCEFLIWTCKRPTTLFVIAKNLDRVVLASGLPFFVGYYIFTWQLGTRLKQQRQLAKEILPT